LLTHIYVDPWRDFMKKMLKTLDSKWGMTLAICLTVVVTSVATSTAATLINGKNIKKGTVASKQIKNGTIVKADLSKKLSVVGPQGPQGVPGAPGATNVTMRRFAEFPVGVGTSGEASVDCLAGEKVVGGGAAMVTGTGATEYSSTIAVSAPTVNGVAAAPDGSTPGGWLAVGRNNAGADRTLVVYALCAKP
jgi:hypothetical protein